MRHFRDPFEIRDLMLEAYLTQGVRIIQNADDFIVPALSTPGGLFSVNEAAQVIWDRISSSNLLH